MLAPFIVVCRGVCIGSPFRLAIFQHTPAPWARLRQMSRDSLRTLPRFHLVEVGLVHLIPDFPCQLSGRSTDIACAPSPRLPMIEVFPRCCPKRCERNNLWQHRVTYSHARYATAQLVTCARLRAGGHAARRHSRAQRRVLRRPASRAGVPLNHAVLPAPSGRARQRVPPRSGDETR